MRNKSGAISSSFSWGFCFLLTRDNTARCKLWVQCKQKEKRQLLENMPLSLASGLFRVACSAVSIQFAPDRPPKRRQLTHVDPSDAFVLVNDEHVEPVSDFDVSLGRAGKRIGQELLHLFQFKLGSLALDGRGRGRVGNLVLLVDLASERRCRVSVSSSRWNRKGRGGGKERTAHHVVEERLHEGLCAAVGAAALALVRTDGVERVDGAGPVAIDAGD